MKKITIWMLVMLTTIQLTLGAWETLDTDTFAAGAEGWTGGAYDSGNERYNSTGDNPNYLIKNYGFTDNDISAANITLDFGFTPDTDEPKLHIYGTEANNDYLLIDDAGVTFKHVDDGGGYNVGNCGAETWNNGDQITLLWNKTSGTWSTYHDNKLCHTVTSVLSGSDTFEIDTVLAHPIYIDNVTVLIYNTSGEGGGGGGGSGYNGTLTVTLVDPNSDEYVTYNEFFNFTVNVTCTVSECGDVTVSLDPAPLDPASGNSEGETWAEMYEEYLDAWEYHTNIHVDIGTYTGVPWYTSSSECSNAYLNQQCPNINEDDVTQSFCMVSDEVSQVFMATAMDRDTESSRTAMGLLNLIRDIASPSYGAMTVWRTGFENGVLDSSEAGNNDCASDADARFIIGAAIIANNTNFNSSVRATANSYLDDACPDFVQYTIWNETGNNEAVCPSGSGECREVSYYSTGGCNVGTNGNFGWGEAFYTGYLGDNAIAMLACYAHTNQTTYRTIASNITQMYLGVAGYNSTSGFVVPDGLSWGLDAGSSGARELSCDRDCGAWEPNDAVRATSICTAGYIADEIMGFNLTSDIKTYCTEWTQASGYTTTTYARQRTPAGGHTGDFSDSYENNGLAAYIDIYVNQANLDERHNDIDLDHYSDNTQSFDYTNCQGIYFPTFPIVSLGYALGYADGAFGVSTANVTKGLISTTPGATPFYTTEYNPHNYSDYAILQDMQPGESTLLWWNVNATSTSGTYTFFAYADSNETGVTTTDSSQIDLTIQETPPSTNYCALLSNVEPDLVYCDDFETGTNTSWTSVGNVTVNTTSNSLDENYSMQLSQDITSNKGFALYNITNLSITTGIVNLTVLFRVAGDDPETRNIQLQLTNDDCGDCNTNAISFTFGDNENIRQQWSTGSNSSINTNWSLNTNYIASIILDLTNNTGNTTLNNTIIGTENFDVNLEQILYLKLGDTTGGDLLDVRIDDVSLIHTPTPTNFTITSINNATNTAINTFNATLSNSTQKWVFTTTTGTITTNITSNTTQLWDVSINATNYFTTNYTSYNVTTNLIGEIQPYTRINATNLTSTPVLTYSLNYTFRGNNTTLQSFNITTGTTWLPLNNNNYTLIIFDASLGNQVFATQRVNVTANPYLTNYTFTLLESNILYFTIRDEETRNILTQNVTLEIISDLQTINRTTTNGTIIITTVYPAELEIVYDSEGYTERSYFYYLQNQTNINLTLYLLNSSNGDFTIITANDESGEGVPNVLVEVLRGYTQSGNLIWETVEMDKTDFAGEAVLFLQFNTIPYRVRVFDNALDQNVHFYSQPFEVTSTTITVILDWLEKIGETFGDITDISFGSLTYDNTTSLWSISYTDNGQNLISEACLTITQHGHYSNTQANETCTNSGTATLNAYYDDDERFTHTATLTYTASDGTEYVGNMNSYNPGEIWQNFGINGLLLGSYIIYVISTILIFNPATLVLGATLGFAAIVLMGLVGAAIPTVIGFILLGGILFLRLRT